VQSADGSEVGRGRGAGDWKWLMLCSLYPLYAEGAEPLCT